MTNENKTIERPPIIAVMGHIDHGKSTILDYIRHANTTDKEVGGITQHVSSYEVEHTTPNGDLKKITFLDTPGHEAFGSIRSRGANIADIVILVVSAEDGVKPQTIEALECIKKENVPYVVAINKIDAPNANIERTKQSLLENEIYIEGYGGDVPVAEVSAKTGEGIDTLLETILLVAELEELKTDCSKPAKGVIIESNVDTKKGITASIVMTDGTLAKGMFVVAGESLAPVRLIERFDGKKINSVCASTPIQIVGWDTLPIVGTDVEAFENKKEAEEKKVQNREEIFENQEEKNIHQDNGKPVVPVVLKADTTGSLEAVLAETKKIPQDLCNLRILFAGVGDICEQDIKRVENSENAFVAGFNVKIDARAQSMAERLDIEVANFYIIYELTEWLEKTLEKKRPRVSTEEESGRLKVLRFFSAQKNKQVIGGVVESGTIHKGNSFKIVRRENEIGKGKITELQEQKVKTSEVQEGSECGLLIESPTEVSKGDRLVVTEIIEK